VVTGDVTQIDLTHPRASGLVRVRTILRDVPGICFVDLDETDVVRHPLVRRIVAAFVEEGARQP
jgi:phosphate starvation-inducible PhoH-like protein